MALLDEMLAGYGDIFSAPFKSMEALWILIPLFIVWIVLEIYFARFKKEELGWNTALANGITLGWLTLQGMKALFEARPENFLFTSQPKSDQTTSQSQESQAPLQQGHARYQRGFYQFHASIFLWRQF